MNLLELLAEKFGLPLGQRYFIDGPGNQYLPAITAFAQRFNKSQNIIQTVLDRSTTLDGFLSEVTEINARFDYASYRDSVISAVHDYFGEAELTPEQEADLRAATQNAYDQGIDPQTAAGNLAALLGQAGVQPETPENRLGRTPPEDDDDGGVVTGGNVIITPELTAQEIAQLYRDAGYDNVTIAGNLISASDSTGVLEPVRLDITDAFDTEETFDAAQVDEILGDPTLSDAAKIAALLQLGYSNTLAEAVVTGDRGGGAAGPRFQPQLGFTPSGVPYIYDPNTKSISPTGAGGLDFGQPDLEPLGQGFFDPVSRDFIRPEGFQPQPLGNGFVFSPATGQAQDLSLPEAQRFAAEQETLRRGQDFTLAPQLANIETQRAGFIADILRNPADALARLFFTRGGTSPLPEVTQADLINDLNERITAQLAPIAGAVGQGFSPPALQFPQFAQPQPQPQPQPQAQATPAPAANSGGGGGGGTATTSTGDGGGSNGGGGVVINIGAPAASPPSPGFQSPDSGDPRFGGGGIAGEIPNPLAPPRPDPGDPRFGGGFF